MEVSSYLHATPALPPVSLGGPQRQYGRCEEVKNPYPIPAVQPVARRFTDSYLG
jgi:hypothetical protein